MTQAEEKEVEKGRSPAAWAFVVSALVCTGVSTGTSWIFFHSPKHLGIKSYWELLPTFAALEILLFACALGAKENLNNPKKQAPGTPGLLVWMFTAFAAFPAYSVAGDWVTGTIRLVVGPVGAVISFHMAMGMDLRHKKAGAVSNSPWAVVAHAIRERLFAFFGLANPEQTALEIRQNRAVAKSIVLFGRINGLSQRRRDGRRGRALGRRLQEQLRIAEVSTDPERADAFLSALAVYKHTDRLFQLDFVSPWASRPAVATETVSATDTEPDTEVSEGLGAGQSDISSDQIIRLPGQAPRGAGQDDDGWSDIVPAELVRPDKDSDTDSGELVPAAGQSAGQAGQPDTTPDMAPALNRMSDPDSPDKWADVLESLYAPEGKRPSVTEVVRHAYRQDWDTATMRAVVSDVLPDAKPDTITKAIRRVREEKSASPDTDKMSGPYL